MLFKDLKPNDQVHILDKEAVEIKIGKVINVAGPRYEDNGQGGYNYNQGMSQGNYSTRRVLDVTIEYKDRNQTYVIPENATIAYANNLVICPEVSSLSSDVEAIKVNAKKIIDAAPLEKERLKKSSELLAEINPVAKEKLEQDKRLTALENDMGDIKSMLIDIKKSLKN